MNIIILDNSTTPMYVLSLRYYSEQKASETALQKRCSRICGQNPR